MAYFLLGLVTLGLLLVGARWYAQANTHDLVQGARTFVAVFSGLASTGLLFTGRFGLALITLAAMVMAIRAIRRGRSGADPLEGAARGDDAVEIETELLAMRLDRSTGEVSGRVRQGTFAGRGLESLGTSQLLSLLAEARERDPQSVSLLEAFLDRAHPDWRQAGGASGGAGNGGGAGGGGGDMDEAEALQILGLEPGAAPEEIRQAHRRLMAKLHPDRGGSTFLATQINRAKDLLLEKARTKRR